MAALARPSPAATINVGPMRQLQTLAQGVAAAQANDIVQLDPGTYTDQTAVITVPLTINGQGATLHISQPIANHKAILVADANLTVENLIFDRAFVTEADGNNGAGIRQETGNLFVDHCTFSNNQEGILANANATAYITVEFSAFVDNGAGDGYTHAIYVNQVAQLIVTSSTFSGTKVGHDIKSRALRTAVTNSTLDDGVTGTTSYAIDLSNGGAAFLEGLVINQGPSTSNPTMVAFGAEGNLNPNSSLEVFGSVFSNTRPSYSVGINNFTTVPVSVSTTQFNDLAVNLLGPGTISNPIPSGIAVSVP